MLPNFLLHCGMVKMNLVFWLKVNFLGRHLLPVDSAPWSSSIVKILQHLLCYIETSITSTGLVKDVREIVDDLPCNHRQESHSDIIQGYFVHKLICLISLRFLLVVARKVIHNFPYIFHHSSGSNGSLNVA